MQTSIAIDTLDFKDFAVEEKLHIGISVKDFKAIVTHAESLKSTITANYSHPSRPLQLAYQEHGMQCEFTLMTIGEYRGSSVTPGPTTIRDRSTRSFTKEESARSSTEERGYRLPNNMPPPSQLASRNFVREVTSQRAPRPSPPPPTASVDHKSLFFPADDEDERQWAAKNYDEEGDELGWDASADNVVLQGCFDDNIAYA